MQLNYLDQVKPIQHFGVSLSSGDGEFVYLLRMLRVSDQREIEVVVETICEFVSIQDIHKHLWEDSNYSEWYQLFIQEGYIITDMYSMDLIEEFE